MLEDLQYVTGGTILIVDDEVDLCLLMKTYFLRKGNQVIIAHTLADAFNTASGILLDVIIIGLPCENLGAIVTNFLALVPDVELITCNNQIVYKK